MDNELRCLLHSHIHFNYHYPLSKLFFQKLPRIACSASGYFFRCTYRYDISAFVSAFRSEVDYIIRHIDNIILCSMMTMLCPRRMSASKASSSLRMSWKCSPVVGSSKINRVGSLSPDSDRMPVLHVGFHHRIG